MQGGYDFADRTMDKMRHVSYYSVTVNPIFIIRVDMDNSLTLGARARLEYKSSHLGSTSVPIVHTMSRIIHQISSVII